MPRLALVTYNARGLAETKTFAKFLQMIQRRKKRENLGAICVQEHNIPRTHERSVTTQAKIAGFTAIISFGRADAPDSSRGGVLTLLVDATLSLKKIDLMQPGIIALTAEWGAKEIKIANVYAPVESLARVDFFIDIRNKLEGNSFIGGDFNCVPDVTLDVESKNPMGYPNRGSQILENMMAEKGQEDARRTQLGSEREFTRTGNNQGGVTSTRIDRWYVPIDTEYLLTFTTENDYIFKEHSSDHRAVTLTLDNKLGTRGKERESIDETLLEREDVQNKVKDIVEECYNSDRSETKKWTIAQSKIHDYLMKESKAKKKAAKSKAQRLRSTLKRLKEKTKGMSPTLKQLNGEKRIQREIFKLENPEVEQDPTERQSKLMFDRAEAGTKAFFSTYKNKASQQWINSVKRAAYQENADPVFDGTTTEKVGEVGNEFVKLYQTIFSQKEIEGEDLLLDRMKKY